MINSVFIDQPFTVTRWLNEGDLIYLNDSQPSKEWALEVLFTPGHTPDSIALFAPFNQRLFVGDTICKRIFGLGFWS